MLTNLEKEVEKVFVKTMIGSNPYLITPDMIPKYEKQILISISDLYQAVFSHYSNLLDVTKDSSIFISLCSILCSKTFEVRKSMKDVIVNLLKSNDKLYSLLTEGSFLFLQSLNMDHSFDVKLISEALLVLYPSPAYDVALLKRILFYSHYPTAVASQSIWDSSSFSAIWDSYVSKFKDVEVSVLLKDFKECYESLIELKTVNIKIY
jgi:hypothetical protein